MRLIALKSALLVSVLVAGCGKSSKSDEPKAKSKSPPEVSTDPSASSQPSRAFDLYVVNGEDSSLSVVDGKTLAVAKTISLKPFAWPHHIQVSPDRRRLVVAAPGMDLSGGHGGGTDGMQGSVIVLSTNTGAIITSRTLPAMNHNGTFSANGEEIWTSLMTAPGAVLALAVRDLSTVGKVFVENGTAEVSFSPDGLTVFAANGLSNSVSAIDAATKVVKATIPVGEDPVGAWRGTDGRMYVDNEHGKSVTVIDPNTLAVAFTFDLGFTPGMVAALPSSEIWVSDADNGKVVFFDAQGKKTGELATGAGAHAIAFSPDRTLAFVSNQMAASVSVVDVASHALLRTIAVGKKPNGLAVVDKATTIAADDPVAADGALELFERLLKPLLSDTTPSSCSQCHLGGVELRQFVKPTQEETFFSLVSAKLIDVAEPDHSKILEFILMAPAGATVDTSNLRKREHDAFSAWIRAAVADPSLLATLEPASKAKTSIEPPTCVILASVSSVIAGESTTLTLQTTGTISAAKVDGKAIGSFGSTMTISPSESATISGEVTGPGGSASCSTTISVVVPPPAAPTCTLTVSPAAIQSGETATLTLSTTGNVASAVVDGSTHASIPVVVTVSPATSKSFVATVTGPGGSSSCTAGLSVDGVAPPAPVPTCVLSASPSAIAAGSSTTLSAVVQGSPTSLVIDGSAIDVGTSTKLVSPASSGTLAAAVTGPGGTSDCSVAVVVTAPMAAPTCSLTASPSTVTEGSSTSLTLVVIGQASNASIAGSAVSVSGGTKDLTPTSSSPFTGTVSGPGGSSSCSTNVTVIAAVDPNATLLESTGVWASLEGQCQSCHSDGGRSVDLWPGAPHFIVQGDPAATLVGIEARPGLINVGDRLSSTLITKPAVQIFHDGGKKFDVNDATFLKYKAFLEGYTP